MTTTTTTTTTTTDPIFDPAVAGIPTAVWFSRHEPTPAQRAEIEAIYGQHTALVRLTEDASRSRTSNEDVRETAAAIRCAVQQNDIKVSKWG